MDIVFPRTLDGIEYQATYQAEDENNTNDESTGKSCEDEMSERHQSVVDILDHPQDDDIQDQSSNPSSAASIQKESMGLVEKDSHERSSILQHPETTFSERWTALVKKFHRPIINIIRFITDRSVRYPRTTMSVVTFTSILLVLVGLLTNFNVNVDEDTIWTPRGSQAEQDWNWLRTESGFAEEPRLFVLMFHNHGENVIGKKQVERIFQVVDAIRSVSGYEEMCSQSGYTNSWGMTTCRLEGVVNFWNASLSIFHDKVQSDFDAIQQMSAESFPNMFPVAEDVFFGFPKRDSSGVLTSAISYSIFLQFPHVSSAAGVETRALDAVLDLSNSWRKSHDNFLTVEVAAHRSFADEFTRAIIMDIPLVPIVFLMMSGFTYLVFYQRHKVLSRGFLGINAVVSVLLAIAAAYGMMFIAGVPFTSITQMLPFILFGIGLDDSFIIMGAYVRTNKNLPVDERIRATVEDVGISIALTSTTSTLAFAFGCTSTIPAVFWVCLYAFPSVMIIFTFQLTYFVAAIVLDEKRIHDNRRDCLTWIKVQEESDQNRQGRESLQDDAGEFFTDRIMTKIGEIILRPRVKFVIVTAFALLAALCAWSASKLYQSFKIGDVLPSDSYITTFIKTRESYSTRSHLLTAVYFRNEDQSDPEVQRQMFEYVDQLVDMKAVTTYPDFFWLRDLNRFVDNLTLHSLDFYSQLDIFLGVDIINKVYGEDIVRDESGKIIESRCFIDVANFDADDIKEQIRVLADERHVTNSQPINRNKRQRSFFTYSRAYNVWEFFSRAVDELILAAVSSVVAVTAISIVFIPHWTAAFYVLPLVTVMYIDILGVMQWSGVTINPVSYVVLVMSVGLIVDFILHVLLKYYELPGNRREKTLNMLRTMGSSILLGGLTTFLGTVPMMFSTSEIFYIIFIGFMALVVLGVSNGLILLPVILATFGTEEQASCSVLDDAEGKQQSKLGQDLEQAVTSSEEQADSDSNEA